jgi:hypothetical protein
MTTILDSIMKLSTRAAESGVLMLDSALKTAQSTVTRLAGQNPVKVSVEPPYNGPDNVDDATSDLINRLLRIAWATPLKPEFVPGALKEVLFSIRQSFGGLDTKDPRALLALPLQIPLSFATLMTQQSLRGLYTASVVGPSKFMDFASYMSASFTDIHVFVSLQYHKQARQFRDFLEKYPDDADTRLKLGQTYIKMGLYDEALRELALAAQTPEFKATALHECTVAAYRAGKYARAVKDGVASLGENPDRLGTRWWVWIAAQKLGGYPAGGRSAKRSNGGESRAASVEGGV